jgi:hypothetical protein
MIKYFITSLFSFYLIISVQAKKIEETFDGADITLEFTSGATKDKIIHIIKPDTDGVTIHVLVPHHAQRFYDPQTDLKYDYTITTVLKTGWELVKELPETDDPKKGGI